MEQYGLKAADAENLVSERKLPMPLRRRRNRRRTPEPWRISSFRKVSGCWGRGNANPHRAGTPGKAGGSFWRKGASTTPPARSCSPSSGSGTVIQRHWQRNKTSGRSATSGCSGRWRRASWRETPKPWRAIAPERCRRCRPSSGQTMGAAGGQGNPAVIRRIVEELF